MNGKTLLLAVFVFFPMTINAEADGPDYWQVWKVRSNDVLNIRGKPNWRATKIGEIPFNGKCIQNLGCVGGLTFEEFTELSEREQKQVIRKRPRWCKIKYKKTTGWVSGKFLMEGQSESCVK